MTDEEVKHREAIRALVTRHNIQGDRGRFADVAACYTTNGVLRWSTGGGQGRAGIAAGLTSGTANPAVKFIRHHLTTMHIEFAPDKTRATGRIYFFVISNAGLDHSGVYVDRYEREAEEWLIAAREVRIDWQSPGSLYPEQVTR